MPETASARDADRVTNPVKRTGSRVSVWQTLAWGGSNPGPRSAEWTERFWDRQGLLLFAFAFAAGIAIYCLLPAEPFWPLLLAISAAGTALALRPGKDQPANRLFILVLCLLLGMTSAAVRTAQVDAPKLAEPMNVSISGIVVERQVTRNGTRLVVQTETVNERSVRIVRFPNLVRVRVRAEGTGNIGDKVRLRARLFPPAGPVSPGAYDFSFRAFFGRIGATGFAYGTPEILEEQAVRGLLAWSAWVNDLRIALVRKIEGVLGTGDESALIAALIVGDRSGISETAEEQLRAAGLAHILAISGLHMALFAGGAFSTALLVMALFPPLALRWPMHKWAAVTALLAATFYLVLSGGSVATQRSYLMIALVFLGVLTGRRGLTLRSVAIAGLFLLVTAPERLFFPGFQMSFAAVISLVAVYDLWRSRETRGLDVREEATIAARTLRFLARWCGGLLVTAFVAGLATGIVGAHHFGRIAPYGLLGNLLGMPVFTLLIMPSGVLSLVLMPLGLAELPLTVMAFGLSLLLEIAAFTAELGGDAGAIGRIGAATAFCFISALFCVLLLPGRLRLLFVLPLFLGVAQAATTRPPDIQIAASGTRIAVRDDAGKLVFSTARDSFTTNLWLQTEGASDSTLKSRKIKSSQRRCDENGCVLRAYGSDGKNALGASGRGFVTIAQSKTMEAFRLDCQLADIIVSDMIAPGRCGARMIFDKDLRQRRGAVSLWLKQTEEQHASSSITPNTNPKPSSPLRGQQDGALIERMMFAIPDPPRPWHRRGTVTRSGLAQYADPRKG